MAVSLREYPTITGKDARNFLRRQEQNTLILKQKVEAKLASLKEKWVKS